MNLFSIIFLFAVFCFLILIWNFGGSNRATSTESRSEVNAPIIINSDGSGVATSTESKAEVTFPTKSAPGATDVAASPTNTGDAGESVGGEKFMKTYKFPYVALLRLVDLNGYEKSHVGSIISESWILTSFIGLNFVYANITVGVANMIQTQTVSSNSFHWYLTPIKAFYITAIKTEPIHFNDAVKSIKLPDPGPSDFKNYDGKLIAIANTYQYILNGEPFQERALAIWNNTLACNRGVLKEGFICTYPTDGFMSDNSVAGEPLVAFSSSAEPILIGIYYNKENLDGPKLRYNSISFLRKWIRDTTQV